MAMDTGAWVSGMDVNGAATSWVSVQDPRLFSFSPLSPEKGADPLHPGVQNEQ